MSIEVCCPKCGRVIYASDEQAGQLVTCPGCQSQFEVPRLPEGSSSSEEPVELSCPKCDAYLLVSPRLAGRRVWCNSCRAVLLISADPPRLATDDGDSDRGRSGRDAGQPVTPEAEQTTSGPMLELTCTCGERVTISESSADSGASCPICGSVLLFPLPDIDQIEDTPEAPATRAPPKAQRGSDGPIAPPRQTAAREVTAAVREHNIASAIRKLAADADGSEPLPEVDLKPESEPLITREATRRAWPLLVVAATCCVAVIVFMSVSGRAPTDRLPLYGTVEIGGAVVASGSISFLPAEGNSGPAANTGIVEGKYRFTKASGPHSGPHDVLICVDRQPSADDDRPGSEMAEDVKAIDIEAALAAQGQPPPSRQTAEQGTKHRWEIKCTVPNNGEYRRDFRLGG